MAVSETPTDNQSLIKINNNSSMRNLENNEINISNINTSSPNVSRVNFP